MDAQQGDQRQGASRESVLVVVLRDLIGSQLLHYDAHDVDEYPEVHLEVEKLNCPVVFLICDCYVILSNLAPRSSNGCTSFSRPSEAWEKKCFHWQKALYFIFIKHARITK